MSLAITLFGTTTKLPDFGQQLGGPPGDLADAPLLAANRHPVAHTKWFFDLYREPGKKIPERVLQGESQHDGTDRGRRQDAIAQDERGRDREEQDEQRILHDAGKPIGKPIEFPGIEREGDDEIDDGERRDQGVDVADELPRVFGEREVVERDRRQRVGSEQAGREEQPAANMPVDRRLAQTKRRQQERETDDDAERHARLGDALLERREIGRRNRRASPGSGCRRLSRDDPHPLLERRPRQPPAARSCRSKRTS